VHVVPAGDRRHAGGRGGGRGARVRRPGRQQGGPRTARTGPGPGPALSADRGRRVRRPPPEFRGRGGGTPGGPPGGRGRLPRPPAAEAGVAGSAGTDAPSNAAPAEVAPEIAPADDGAGAFPQLRFALDYPRSLPLTPAAGPVDPFDPRRLALNWLVPDFGPG